MEKKQIDIKLTPNEVKNICEQFTINENSKVYDTENEYRMKKAMEVLYKSDWIIMCLYAELQSERKLAEILGVSRTPIGRELKRIKEIIRKELENDKKDCISIP